MTAEGEAISITAVESADSAQHSTAAATTRFERLLVALGDRLNPILVKETRQALKSRQFVVTFSLLLLFGWIWSLLGVASVGQGIYYGSYGPTLFVGYLIILAFPLLVVVPYSAFRSLAAEQEERTYEMLSITTLGPRQIVLGKLASAAVQMLVYLSAITPCLAFTYMLRGLSFPTILLVVFYVSLESLALSMLCLFLGTLSTEKYVQVVLAVFVTAGLFLALFLGCYTAIAMVYVGEQMFREEEFWIANAAMVTFVLGYCWLTFEAAAARITFASDNRSTRLRFVMLVQFAIWTAWMTYACVENHGDEGPMECFAFLSVLHWFAMGVMMTGESPDLSLRVRRELPRSSLGRMFLTWFNPGPGTGYVFALAGLLGTLLIAAVGVGVSAVAWPTQSRRHPGVPLLIAFLGMSYAAFFLGLGVLIMRALRRRMPVGIMTGVLFQLLLVLTFSGVPALVHWMSDFRDADYSVLQVVSPIWTLFYVLDEGLPVAESGIILIGVPLAALVVLLFNVRGIVKEVRLVRIVVPERVAEDDAAAAAEKSPPMPIRKSPWDEQ